MIRFFRMHLWLILILALMATNSAQADGMQIVFVDVGAADCSILISDDQVMMIDTGKTAANYEHIQLLLERLGVTRINHLVLTHPHDDHIGNAVNIMRDYSVDQVIMPPIEYSTFAFTDLVAALDARNDSVVFPQVGDAITLGSAEIVVYGPNPVAYLDENNWSIVQMARYAGRSILFTGDVEDAAEQDLLINADLCPLQADILKVPHHGSDTSSTLSFIQAVSPAYAIVSCSSNASKGYPSTDVADRLMRCGVADIFTTERRGDILVSVEPDGSYTISALTPDDATLLAVSPP